MKRPPFNPPRTVNKTEAVAGGTELILSISKRGLPEMNPRGANLSDRAFAFMPGYSRTLQTKPKRFPLDPHEAAPTADFDVAVVSLSLRKWSDRKSRSW